MPQNPAVIATRTVSGDVHIFDYTRHPSKPSIDAKEANPELRCSGLNGESYGLSWSSLKKGYVASCSIENAVALWDVQAGSQHRRTIEPLWINSNVHNASVEDVSWHEQNENVFGSVAEDGMICIWDLRQSAPTSVVRDFPADTFCISFNKASENLFVVGNSEHQVMLWDLRNLSGQPVHILEGHKNDVLQVAWSPFHEQVLASCSSDRRVCIWDLARIGAEQSSEDAEDGPPELLFMHGGHCNRIPDLSWNPNLPWVMASVAEDNIVQIWQMACEIYEREDEQDEDEAAEEIQESVLHMEN
jgi:histone-binding protein RBBP4